MFYILTDGCYAFIYTLAELGGLCKGDIPFLIGPFSSPAGANECADGYNED